jgi:hypothetical protein
MELPKLTRDAHGVLHHRHVGSTKSGEARATMVAAKRRVICPASRGAGVDAVRLFLVMQ